MFPPIIPRELPVWIRRGLVLMDFLLSSCFPLLSLPCPILGSPKPDLGLTKVRKQAAQIRFPHVLGAASWQRSEEVVWRASADHGLPSSGAWVELQAVGYVSNGCEKNKIRRN